MKFRVLGILSLVLLTILMIADFFPDHYLAINIQGYIFWILLAALVIFVSMIRIDGLKNTIFIFIYLIGLILLLTAFGGSSNDFSPNQTGFWILIILVSFSIYSEWKKHRSKTN